MSCVPLLFDLLLVPYGGASVFCVVCMMRVDSTSNSTKVVVYARVHSCDAIAIATMGSAHANADVHAMVS